MIIHTDIHQGHEQWDEWRSVRATASEFGKIFTGGGKVSTQRESYMRKCAIARKYKLPSWSGNAATDRGHALEPVARDLFVSLSGVDVREVACIEHENGLCGGSPDGLIYSSDGRLVSGLEIKCFNYDKHMGIVTKKVLPTENKPQVHGSMWLAKVDSWQFMAFHDEAMPFDHCVIETTPDSYTDNLENEVLSFCEELDQRADEFISDFKKSMEGTAMRLAMPTLFRQLEADSII
jgi:hypothetical protein